MLEIRNIHKSYGGNQVLKGVDINVEKGDVIATVAEPNGKEYKDGAHLHFEVFENGQNIDPSKYLTLEEK